MTNGNIILCGKDVKHRIWQIAKPMPSSIIILLSTLCSKVFLDNQVGSLPENPTIANVFYRSGLMESWGRGIGLIMQKCEEAGLTQPTIDVSVSFVNLTIYFAQSLESGDNMTNVLQDVLQDVPQEILSQLSERQIEILKMIKNNPKVTREEMSLKVNKSSKTVARDLDEIRKFLRIEFVGTPSDGMWIIAKE